MKKVMQNKRLLVTLLAGVLLITAAIGAGTWAWFTSSTTVEDGSFFTATVALGDTDGDWGVWNFIPTAPAIAAQGILEDVVKIAGDYWNNIGNLMWEKHWGSPLPGEEWKFNRISDPVGGDHYLYCWDNYLWPNGYSNSADVRNVMFAIIDDASLLIPADFADVEDDGDIVNRQLVTPGSLIFGEFTIENESNIPVVFRIAQPTSPNDDSWVAMGVDARVDPAVELILYENADGNRHWYGLIAVDSDITITVAMYVPGDATLLSPLEQNSPFNIGEMAVEIVQAANNAPVFEWGISPEFYLANLVPAPVAP